MKDEKEKQNLFSFQIVTDNFMVNDGADSDDSILQDDPIIEDEEEPSEFEPS